ncbi:MAG: DNA topoisomerase I, partial [Gemmatimonadetes bacterium]|nr:DNA topoisomerase I [Gemmatimonadota bacterium]
MAIAPKRTVKTTSSAKAVKAEEPAKKPAGRARPKAEKPRAGAGAGARAGDALVIVESPTKAKTIGKYLGRGYDVKATVGHLRDLPTRELGVDVDNGFEPKYVTIKGKTKTLAELKKAAKTASSIYLATDPDREGEAIAWHVADQITPAKRVPVHRVLFEEITRDAVVAAMQ